MINQRELKRLLHYNPETGVFTRLTSSNRYKKGDIAGTNSKGHLIVRHNKKTYYLHRLAWLYVFGEMPSKYIDHIDGNGANNKISNLRDVTHRENMKNLPKRKDNSSGATGVSWDNNAGKWTVRIKTKEKYHYLGLFKDKEKAIEARKEAEIKYGFHKNHGR